MSKKYFIEAERKFIATSAYKKTSLLLKSRTVVTFTASTAFLCILKYVHTF